MQIVPTSLVRISRVYMLTAVFYLLVTLVIGILRVVTPFPDERVHWMPAILAWVSFPIMGAYYQFFPTLQGRDLRLGSLTLPQYGLVNVGVLGVIVAGFLGNSLGFTLALSTYGAGALLFVAVILSNVTVSRCNLSLRFFLASLSYYTIAIVFLLLGQWGLGPSWATRPLLLHLFGLGWAALAIMGAEYSMVPMLQLKELHHPRLADIHFYLANGGVVGLAVGLATNDARYLGLAGVLMLVAIGVFLYQILTSLLTGPSRLPQMDLSVRYFLVGLAYFGLSALLGTVIGVMRWSSITPVHIHLALIGFVSNTIIGAMYHIVPFVVWWEVYAPRLGTAQVPLLKQLFNGRSAELQLYAFNTGLLVLLAGFAFGTNLLLVVGGTLLLLASLAFLQQMLRVAGHRQYLSKGSPA